MKTLDLSTIVGLAAGIGLLLVASMANGSPGAFLNVPSLLIVVLGTLAVTAISFTSEELRNACRSIMHTFHKSRHDPRMVALAIVKIADKSRRDGILSLERDLPELRRSPFLGKAVSLVRDGAAVEQIERLLASEVHAIADRHKRSAAVLRRAADVAPAMGLIGTLVGLVQMLGNLDDPGTIGPAMAVALLTTFWGAVLANMVFAPLASKLERNSREETLANSVIAVGAASIGRQENPRHLEALINAMLPPAHRIQFFD